jgi:hypothetical protein
MKVDRHLSIAEVGAAGFLQGPRDNTPPPRNFVDLGVAALATLYPMEIAGVTGEFTAFENTRMEHGHTALAGLKLRTRLINSGRTNWRLFGQMLGGSKWTGVTARRHVLQPGVGADDYLGNGLTLHVQYDYTFAPGDSYDLPTGRFLIGLALPLGAR